MTSENVLELRNVEKTYMLGEVKLEVLKNVNLKVRQGEFLSVMGPSGSGKSTLLNMIGMLDKPTAGSVYIEGKNTSEFDDEHLATLRGEKIGFIFQTFNLIARLTALENVMLPMWLANRPEQERKKRGKYLLEIVGLGERINHNPTQLSGGERQRVAIARALANDPSVILADEPTGNLDTKSGAEILNIIKELHKKEKRTIIVVTHEAYIAKAGERIITIIDGTITSDKKFKSSQRGLKKCLKNFYF